MLIYNFLMNGFERVGVFGHCGAFTKGSVFLRCVILLLCMLTCALFATGAQAAIVFTLTSGNSSTNYQLFPSDSNNCPAEGPLAAYVTGTVTNTGGAAVTGVEANLSGLSSGFSLTGTQASLYSIGTLAAGDSALVAWHISYPCDTSKKKDPGPTTMPMITLTGDAVASSATSLTLESAKAISANAGGNVSSTTLGAGAIIGQTITANIEYDFGGSDAGDGFSVQPAGNIDFDASCLKLIGSKVISSNINAAPAGTEDTLYFTSTSSQSGNGYFIVMEYYYKYVCANTTTTARPFAVHLGGGTSQKFTGNYDASTALVFDFPTSSNPFTITKTASSTSFPSGAGPYTLTYTVTLTNPSAFDALIDEFIDVLPMGVSFQGLDASSDITLANSGVTPAINSTGALVFSGLAGQSYTVLANSSISLIYAAQIINTDGDYVNTASAQIGGVELDTASATVSIGGAPSLTAVKSISMYDPLASGLYAVPGNDVVYTFTITNTSSGSLDAGSLKLIDMIPESLIFYNDDFDDSNAGKGPFKVDAGTSGIACCDAPGVASYATSTTLPLTFSPIAPSGYDDSIKGFRLQPTNSFAGNRTLTISFRAKIK